MAAKYVRLDEVIERLGLQNLTPSIDPHEVKIYHRSVNRPAFQLAGFYDYFDHERVQVIGWAEQEFIKTLDRELAAERFEKLLSFNPPAIIMARGIQAPQQMLDKCVKHGVPFLASERSTAYIIVNFINWMNEKLAPTEGIHGVLVDVYGEGILITGSSGVGKSEVALELIKRGHRLVADDIIEISRINENLLMGSAPMSTRHFIELRGVGVIDVASLYGVESVKDSNPIDMIIELDDSGNIKTFDRLGLDKEYQEILGVKVVKHTIPVRPGRNIAIIVESAAVNNRQRKMGYDAAEELCRRVSEEIKNKGIMNYED
ncbi:MAG: HPr(Ser) kinase/phosphatase [Lachnospiraceae bacterium]|nr:HPr(Ser) kinase/phosphatase [Lachnospiraceae bacterium]